MIQGVNTAPQSRPGVEPEQSVRRRRRRMRTEPDRDAVTKRQELGDS